MGILSITKKHQSLPYEISQEYKRYDQMQAVTMRIGWDPDIMAHVERFLNMRMGVTRRPGDHGFEDVDVALARGAWCLEDDAGGPMSGAGVGNQAFYSWDGEVFAHPATFDNLKQASAVVKQGARFLGASLVGISDYDERWVYTHSFNPITKVHAPVEFPFTPKSIIVMAIEMNYEAYCTSSSYLSSAATGMGYGQMAVTAHRVANFIRELGYHAVPCGNDTAMSIPLAIQAGLGEISRLGLLVTPEFGPRVRLCKVITDLPLQADKPITFGVMNFCKTCMKCAEVCPANVISKDREPSFKTVSPANNPGVKKWYNKVENCFKYWAVKVDCSACIASCPYNKPNTWTHRVGLRLAQTPAKGMLKWLDGVLGYGKTFDKAAMAHWWHDRPGVTEKNAAAGNQGAAVTVSRAQNREDNLVIQPTDTPADVFKALSERLNRHPERLSGVSALLQFSLSGEHGGNWYVKLGGGQAEIGMAERPDANATIEMKDSDFIAIVSKKLSPPAAMMSGRIRIRGEVSMALKIRQIFR
ncbi:MAG: reductive dehalogenase [Syntrophorhabdales bacterium]|jgi:reductive dehalogenase